MYEFVQRKYHDFFFFPVALVVVLGVGMVVFFGVISSVFLSSLSSLLSLSLSPLSLSHSWQGRGDDDDVTVVVGVLLWRVFNLASLVSASTSSSLSSDQARNWLFLPPPPRDMTTQQIEDERALEKREKKDGSTDRDRRT